MRLRWIVAPLIVAVAAVTLPYLLTAGDIPSGKSTTDVITTTTYQEITPETLPRINTPPSTVPPTTPTTIPTDPVGDLILDLEAIPVPTYPEIACAWVSRLGSNKYLDRAEGLCLPIAEAYLDLIEGRVGIASQLDRLPPAPGDDEFVLEFFIQDVIHMVYVMSFESGGLPDGMLANGMNWGCPAQEYLRSVHPDPDGSTDGRAHCPWFQNRVPVAWVSHMAHTFEGRSMRTLGYLVNPYELYDAALLGFALVFETGGNGWYHWWHIHWTLNRYITPLGIQGVYFCPPDPYWQNVRGGRQACPFD